MHFEMPLWLQEIIPLAISLVWVVLAALSSAHALLNKREFRAVTGWVGILWLAPFLGLFLYWVLGVNRIRRKAHKLRMRHKSPVASLGGASTGVPSNASGLRQDLQALIYEVTNLPLTSGNLVEPLIDGDEAFPAMLTAIEGAERSVYLLTYIFETDRWGMRVIDALAAAQERGVEVRVIVDAKKADDALAFEIANKIAKRVEEEMTFPGEIKVTVLREVRAEATAR